MHRLKPFYFIGIVLLITIVGFVLYRRAGDPDRIAARELEGIKAAKPGIPIKPDTVVLTPRSNFQLSGTGMPGVSVLDSQNRAMGVLSAKGHYIVIDSTLLSFTSVAGEVYQINIRFPGQMYLPNLASGAGTVEFINTSTPGGAHQSFSLVSNKKLLLGYFWTTGDSPQSLIVEGKPVVKQQMITDTLAPGKHTECEVQVKTDGGMIAVQPLSTRKYVKDHMQYDVYIQTSWYRSPDKNIADQSSGYILHGIIVRHL